MSFSGNRAKFKVELLFKHDADGLTFVELTTLVHVDASIILEGIFRDVFAEPFAKPGNWRNLRDPCSTIQLFCKVITKKDAAGVTTISNEVNRSVLVF
jgi:hypothetical protein